jgi:hypothetical protein
VYDGGTLSFHTAKNYAGPDLQVKISNDYNGGGDPYSANWTPLTFNPSPGSWEWTPSGDIDISSFAGTDVYIAFQYTSNSTESATWEVDDILVTATQPVTVNELPEEPSIKVFPLPASDIMNIHSNIEQGQFMLSDLTGRVLINGDLSKEISLNVSELNDGLYILTIQDELNRFNKSFKVVIK